MEPVGDGEVVLAVQHGRDHALVALKTRSVRRQIVLVVEDLSADGEAAVVPEFELDPDRRFRRLVVGAVESAYGLAGVRELEASGLDDTRELPLVFLLLGRRFPPWRRGGLGRRRAGRGRSSRPRRGGLRGRRNSGS